MLILIVLALGFISGTLCSIYSCLHDIRAELRNPKRKTYGEWRAEQLRKPLP